jgi:phosphoenolpyruvate carboxylase
MLVLVSLAKTDMRILERYQKELVSPHLRELGEALKIVYKQVQEFSKNFLGFYENDSYFKYFIEDAHYRADYLVPLHLLQIEMLRRYRARKDIEVMKKINFIESILLISIGLQNSG